MITPDGWLDWAERLEPRYPAGKEHVNGGVNPVRGVFLHSAEGYGSVLLDPNSIYGYNGNLSWHASNLMNGRFIQHYPFTAQCWHATAANNTYVGIENEGDYPKEPTLTDAQIENNVRLIRDLSAWKGWAPRRPTSAADKTYTLWEHNEVVRLGGTATSCPSGRIPWNEILRRLDAGEEEIMQRAYGNAERYKGGATYIGRQLLNVLTDFRQPAVPKQARIEIFKRAGAFLGVGDGNGGDYAGCADVDEIKAVVDVKPDADGNITLDCGNGVAFRELRLVGVWS